MPPTCSICSSGPKLATIDALVTEGKVSLRKIADAHGVSYQSLRDHRNNGHAAPRSPRRAQTSADARDNRNRADAPLPPPDDVTGGPATSALDHIRGVVRRLESRDTSAMTDTQLTAHIENLRRAVETLSRLEPPPPAATVRFADVAGLPELFAILARHLEPLPDVRLALLADLESSGVLAMMSADEQMENG